MVVLATDGFFEWGRRVRRTVRFQRSEQAVREARHLAPEEIIVEIYQAVKHFAAGTKQTDDLTAVVIKRVPKTA